MTMLWPLAGMSQLQGGSARAKRLGRLVVYRDFSICHVRPVLGSDTAVVIVLGTPRRTRIEVRRAPVIRHVVQARAGTRCQQEDQQGAQCDSHGLNDGSLGRFAM